MENIKDFSYSGVFLIYLLSQYELTYEYSYVLIDIKKKPVNDTRKLDTIQVTI